MRAVTPLALEIYESTGIGLDQLYTIQCAAKALRARAEKRDFPYSDLIDCDALEAVLSLQAEMRSGWTHSMAAQILEDLGLVSMPDNDLIRSLSYFRLFPVIEGDVPEWLVAVLITRSLRAFAVALYGSFHPGHLYYLKELLISCARSELLEEQRGSTS